MKKIFSLLSVALFCLAANAQLNLGDIIKSTKETAVVDGKTMTAVTLTESNSYVLDAAVDLGTTDLIIYGGEATVTVKGEGQIATSGYLKIVGVNFDCENGTVAPIAMSATPDSTLYSYDDATATYRFTGANQKVFVDDNVINLTDCKFRELKTPLFFANKQPWALKAFAINNCIIQRNSKDDTALINLVGCGASNIKNIGIINSTIYNTNTANTSSYGLIRQNTANDPYKIWGMDVNGEKETMTISLINNTFSLYGKQFANNCPRNQIELNFKQNVFYNCPKIYQIDSQNRGSKLVYFDAQDNLLWQSAYSVESNDLHFATVDSTATFTPATEALDFNNVAALKANFANNTLYSPYAATCGDPRWTKVQFKSEITKNVPGGAHEAILTPDMLMKKTLEVGEKDAINDTDYPWAFYTNSTSPLEVTTQGPYSSYNPYTGLACDPNYAYSTPWEGVTVKGFYYVTNTNGKYDVNKFKSIKVTSGKYLDVLVTNMTKVGFVLTGAGSNVNSAKVSVYNAKTCKLVDSKISADMAGKSQSASASGSKAANSSYLEFDGLDPDTYYDIVVEQNANDVAIHSILFWDTDNTIIPEEYHSPKIGKAGDYEVVSTADMLYKPTSASRYAFNPVSFAWAKYIDLGSDGNGNFITEGLYEATRGGAYSTIDIESGKKYAADFQGINIGSTTAGCQYVWSSYDLDVIANGGGWLDVHNYGAPKINADYKSMTFNVTGTAAVRFVLSGGAGKDTNTCKITVTDAQGNVVAEKISDNMPQKSNKLANTNTSLCTIDGLDVNQKYTITISRNENDVYVYALHLTNDATVFAAADAMGETDAISEVSAADNAVKTVKFVQNGRIVIKSAKGTFSVAGAQLK